MLMTLDELKRRLEIPLEDKSRDDFLLTELEDTIDFVQRHCKQEFDVLPSGLKGIIAKIIKSNIKSSESEGEATTVSFEGISQTFKRGSTETMSAGMEDLLKPYIKSNSRLM